MSAEVELSDLSREALKDRWIELIGAPPPPRINRQTMVRILTCELQWKQSGHNRTALRRQLLKTLEAARTATPKISPGARLVREWNGREHVVDVLDEGFVWNGASWRSLSAIAREITGTKWSGPRFFGVAS
ncbi:MAG: DUF2924 domain-containing protein [Pseudomonadota bacterium]